MEKKFEFDSTGLESLKVSVANADLQIEPVEQGNILAYVEVDSNNYTPETDRVGKKLHIKFQKGMNISIPFVQNLFEGQSEVDNIRLMVPKSIVELDVKNASGDISISEFDLKTFKISNVSGDIKIKNCTAESLHFGTVSGDIKFIDSNYLKGKFNSVSGDLSLKGLLPMKRETEITSVSGDACVTYSQAPAFEAHLSSVSGEISSNAGLVKIEKNRYRSTKEGSQEYLKMNSVSGDLVINAHESDRTREVNQKAVVEKTQENLSPARSSTIEENLQDKETKKIVDLFNEGKLTREYAFEMLSILGYCESEIEEMLSADARSKVEAIDDDSKEVESQKEIAQISESPAKPPKEENQDLKEGDKQ